MVARDCWVIEAIDEATATTVARDLEDQGDLRIVWVRAPDRTTFSAIGDSCALLRILQHYEGVRSMSRVSSPFKLVSREVRPDNTVVRVPAPGGLSGGLSEGYEAVFGDPELFSVIAGPCGVESRDQLMNSVGPCAKYGARGFRGGAFKPRTSPHSFHGLGVEGLKILREAALKYNRPVFTEVMAPDMVEVVGEYADCFQIGARSMQNYDLLREVGRHHKPVLLKRGMSATLKELLLAAEYVVSEGNGNVILCERGIRTYETATRNTLDLSAVPWLQMKSHLPVIVDPSHGTGLRALIIPLSRAALAVGASGIIVEVHHDPERALSDGPQALTPEMFKTLIAHLVPIASAMGKTL